MNGCMVLLMCWSGHSVAPVLGVRSYDGEMTVVTTGYWLLTTTHTPAHNTSSAQ